MAGEAGNHDDRNRRIETAHFPEKPVAGESRQVQVEHDQIGLVLSEPFQSSSAVGGVRDRVAVLFKHKKDHIGDGLIVLYYQYQGIVHDVGIMAIPWEKINCIAVKSSASLLANVV